MYVNEELKFLSGRRGVGFGEGGQVRCEQRSEVFVKIVDMNREVKFL